MSMDKIAFKFGSNVRTQEEWEKAGPSRIWSLNAQFWAASSGIAVIALQEGGAMAYQCTDKWINSEYFPYATILK